VLKAAVPDLVVEQIDTSGGVLQVSVRNIGPGTVTQPFWVDLYIDPAVAPSAVNQTWNTVGSRGLVWAVDTSALPLVPGAGLTLTVGDRFFRPDYSRQGGPIAGGTRLFAQVDSFNANTSFGAVLETHELAGGPYNNISGPIASGSLP
jgi:hypothetical protein